jgi:membrane-associated HD superfamily phosphohydrolase
MEQRLQPWSAIARGLVWLSFPLVCLRHLVGLATSAQLLALLVCAVLLLARKGNATHLRKTAQWSLIGLVLSGLVWAAYLAGLLPL